MRRDNRHRVFDGDGMMNQIRAEDERPDSAPALPAKRRGVGLPILRLKDYRR